MENELQKHWQEIMDALPPLATREQISTVTGGLIAKGTLANRDCYGTGISNKTQIGKKVCYPRADVIAWLMTQERNVSCDTS